MKRPQLVRSILFRGHAPWRYTARSFLVAASEGQFYEVKKTLPYSQARMFDIVSSVDRYHEFIPYCKESTVTKVDSRSNLPEEATLSVGWQAFEESFESKLACVRPNTVIAEALNNDLFDTLYTEWNIYPDERHPSTHSVIDFKLKYHFHNPIYNMVSSTFASKVTTIMIKAFEKRAREIERRHYRHRRQQVP